MNKNDQDKHRLKDLIDINHFQDLLDRLNEIYPFPSSIIDNEGNILIATAWQDICTRLTRKDEECAKECIKFDQYTLDNMNHSYPAVPSYCPHGLVYNATPIIIDGVYYGSFVTGQFFLEEPDIGSFRELAGKYGLPEDGYLKSVKKIPVWTEEKFNSYLSFIKGLIAVMSECASKNLKEMENEKQVRKKENRYRSILETAMDGFWVVDMQGRIVEVNDTYCEMSGYSRQELLRMNINDLEAVQSAEEVRISIKETVKKGGNRILGTHIRKDGSLFDIDISVKYQPDEESFVCFLRDVSEQRQNQKVLKQSREKYLTLFNQSVVGIYLHNFDGSILDVNKRACELSGYSRNELLKLNVFDLHPADSAINTPKEVIIRQWKQWQSGQRTTVEAEHQNKYGKVLPVQITTGVVNFEDRNLLLALVQDITERKRNETEIRKSEARFKNLVEMLPEAVFEADLDLNLTFVNQKALSMFGYTKHDFENGLNCLQMITKKDAERAGENIEKRIRGAVFGANEYLAIKKDGATFPVLLHASPIIDRDIPVGIRGIVIDITEKKEIEAHLQNAQKMESIGTLAGGIAHDFNNLLSPIMLHTEIVMNDLTPDDPLMKNMKGIYQASERARDLVMQILTLASKRTKEKVPLKASLIVKEAVKFLRSTIPTTIDIQFDNRASQDTVMADAVQLNQIVMNLCANAAHSMRENGGVLEIVLDSEDIHGKNTLRYLSLKPGRYLKISVRDNGTGIAPNIINRIFEPYFTTKAKGEGTGLGLAIVHGIIHDYGGSINVESKTGYGTTFYVYLPLTDEEISQPNGHNEEMPKGDECILFVDDEESVVEINKQIIERLGYRVEAWKSSVKALEVFRDNPGIFDLVITDMTMPVMTGKDLAAEIKKIRSDIPVILCTGYSDQIDELSAKGFGINAFIMKPIVMKDMANMIRRVLDNKH